jgi:hypothetical protein
MTSRIPELRQQTFLFHAQKYSCLATGDDNAVSTAGRVLLHCRRKKACIFFIFMRIQTMKTLDEESNRACRH